MVKRCCCVQVGKLQRPSITRKVTHALARKLPEKTVVIDMLIPLHVLGANDRGQVLIEIDTTGDSNIQRDALRPRHAEVAPPDTTTQQ
jgi:NAD(P)H-dependent FMN reductase